MTIEKALKILEEHPEILESAITIISKYWNQLTMGQKLDLTLACIKVLSKK